MASSASLGATNSASNDDAQHFYTLFNEQIDALRQRIASANDEGQLESIGQDYLRIRQRLTDVTSLLPKYDQELHEKNVKLLSDALTSRREQIAPKKRFAFKRTAATSSTSPLPSVKSYTPTDSLPTMPSTSSSAKDDTLPTDFQEVKNKTDQTIVMRPSNDGKFRDLHFKNLVNCKVDLRSLDGEAAWSALQLRNCVNCTILAGRIDGSVMVHNDVGGNIIVGCRQFRLHNATNTVVVISTTSVASLENGTKVKFGPANDLMLGNVGSVKSQVPAQVRVQDFKHVNTSQPSPNWTLMSASESKQLFDKVKF